MHEKKVELILLFEEIMQNNFLNTLEALENNKQQSEIYIVGGALRDALLGIRKPSFDLDLVVQPKSATRDVAEILSHELGCHFFELDSERDTYRISMDGAQIDINGIRGDEIIDDLFLRDFSINALCIPLDNFLRVVRRGETRMPVLDYFQSIDDLKLRRIRIHHPSSFADDPLRMLRAYRLAGEIEGIIDPFTHEQISLFKNSLFSVSGERIRDEWLKILSLSKSSILLEKMDQSGLLGIVFPFIDTFQEIDRTYTHKLQVRRHTLESLSYLEEIIERITSGNFPYAKELRALLEEALIPGRPMLVLLKLSTLLHDIGKPDTISNEGEKLRFFDHEKTGAAKALLYFKDLHLSNKEIDFMEALILEHMRPHQLSNAETLTERAKYRFFSSLKNPAIPLLLLALADAYATRRIPIGTLLPYEDFVKEMLDYAFREDLKKLPPLLDGYDIMSLLKLAPSPLIGQIQASLTEAQHLKKVSSKREAEEFVLNYLAKPERYIEE